MSTPLFLDQEHKLSFTKIAMPVKLSDDPASWQREVASEIYKQLPYISEYSVNVVLERVDPARGFAFGQAEVSNLTEAPEKERASLPKIRIPIIVKDRLLQSFDVFMDGKSVLPLNESRLRSVLMRTDATELSTRKPSDPSMVDQLYPPTRSNYGFGPSTVGGDGTKVASLTQAIAHTIPEVEADALVDQISKDMALKVAAAKNQVFAKLAMVIAASEKVGIEKTAEALVRSIRPNVVQLRKLASGDFLVKWANTDAFAPQEAVVPPEQAAEMTGNEKVPEMGPGGTVTLSTNTAKKTSLSLEKIEQISDFGYYEVWDADSNEKKLGWVLPVMDLEMHPLELFVFSGDGYAVQDQIAGNRGNAGADIEGLRQGFSQPQGDGTFVHIDSGKAVCLPPMTIQNSAQGPDGQVELHGENLWGSPVTLRMAPGLQTIEELEEGVYAIPDTLGWISLQNLIHLASSPLEVGNVSEAQKMPGSVDVRSSGQGEFSLEGQPLDKVATVQKQFIKIADAHFLLVGMGMNPNQAASLLKQAEKQGLVKVAGLRSITPLAHLHQEMVKEAAKLLEHFPYDLRRNLVKEAAALEDGQTADKILALNFLNPENVGIFASYLPELDTAASKLAEMLMASRLGLNQLPEGAVERAMKNLEEVIAGLKALQQKELV